MSEAQSPVRVFISYSQESPAHMERCRELADRLRDDGVEASIDRYVPAPTAGWPRWMQQQITAAKFVILVCTPTFCRRFEGTETPGTGHGATWEGMLAQQVLHDSGSHNLKFVPVLFEGESPEAVPLTMRPFSRYTLWSGYDALYRHLTDQPAVIAPPLGKKRVLPPSNGAVHSPPSPASPPESAASGPSPMPPEAAAVLRARDRTQALYELLMLLFDPPELRTWLRFIEEGEVVLRSLPGDSVSKAELIFKATDVLGRRGLINDDFFKSLRDALPSRAAVIEHVRARWSDPSSR